MKQILRNKVLTSVIILVVGTLYGATQLVEFWNGTSVAFKNEIQTDNQEIDRLKGELSKVKAFAENIPAVKQSFKEQTLQLEAILESIPRTYELNGLLKRLNLLAQSTGVEIVSFKPQNDERSLELFKVMSIDVTLRGAFVSTLVFFDQVSKLKRVVSFEDIRMSATQKTSGEKGPLIAETSLKMNAFRLSEG
ncbi:hypothetical protein EBR78_11535 [bacterium]|nr:hypothetical protein [bacterium]NBX81803.1 hypothetical protein [bacterium]